MSDNGIVVSVKDKFDPNEPLFVIAGHDWENFSRNARDVLGPENVESFFARIRNAFLGPKTGPVTAPQAVSNIQAAFPGAQPVGQPTFGPGPSEYDQWAGTNAQPPQPAQAYQPQPAAYQPGPDRPVAGPPPAAAAPTCECGYPRVFKTGPQKKDPSKTYRMWACPLPQGPAQHNPVWL